MSIGKKIAAIYGMEPPPPDKILSPPGKIKSNRKPGSVVSVLRLQMMQPQKPQPQIDPSQTYQHMSSSYLEGMDEKDLSALIDSMNEQSKPDQK